MATDAVRETAPAKINLCLHVTGRRADGYHLLDSLVVFADVADSVDVSAGTGLSLHVSGPEAEGLITEPDNLVLRAARMMGVTDATLVLDKRLPVSSGIGGGSADAAAALRVFARLTRQDLPSPTEALRLGADVPVCLVGRPTRMSGIGETLAPLPPLPPLWTVLANPRVPVPTPEVFAVLTRWDNPPVPDLPGPALGTAASFANWLRRQTRNDLVAPARLVAPVLADVQAAIAATGDCLVARMSGSGGTHFGLYPDIKTAHSAAAALSLAHPNWWIAAGAILTENSSERAA
jgi:4-diphosphocytidyl-2-C-methyl-D-erythritol kinase